MARVAIFGDIGGHSEELYAELVRLGADPETTRLPEDLVVIQVGDLVHRGPDSTGVLDMVEHAMTTQPQQWVQLSGNHEAQYLRPPTFKWSERLAKVDRERLRSWWAEGLMRVAAAVRTGAGEEVLVTHAGLTQGSWYAIGHPAGADTAAEALNALTLEDRRLWRAGLMLGGGATAMAGPWWAEASNELYAHWGVHTLVDSEPLPFSQVHGHSSVFAFDRQAWRPVPLLVREHLRVDDIARHVTLTLPGGRIVGIDPGHGTRRARSWAPLVLDDATGTSR